MTGTKEGCSNGNCGTCTVIMNGRPVNACLVLGLEAEGAELRTIEGVADGTHLDEVQSAFLEALLCSAVSARQASSCSPKLLEQNPNPTEDEIRFFLAGNSCRCTGYDKIVRAVQAAAEKRQAATAN